MSRQLTTAQKDSFKSFARTMERCGYITSRSLDPSNPLNERRIAHCAEVRLFYGITDDEWAMNVKKADLLARHVLGLYARKNGLAAVATITADLETRAAEINQPRWVMGDHIPADAVRRDGSVDITAFFGGVSGVNPDELIDEAVNGKAVRERAHVGDAPY